MKKLVRFLLGEKQIKRKTLAEYQQEMIGNVAREQFETLANRGIKIQFALL